MLNRKLVGSLLSVSIAFLMVSLAIAWVPAQLTVPQASIAELSQEKNGAYSRSSTDPTPSAQLPGNRGGSSPRTVLVEKFTADWCQYCPAHAFSLNRAYSEYTTTYGEDSMILLEHHSDFPSDPLSQLDSASKWSYYSPNGYPTAIFDGGGNYNDGTLWYGTGGTTKYQNYVGDKSLIDLERQVQEGANLTVVIENPDLEGTTGSFQANVTISDTIQAAPLTLKVRYAVYETNIWHDPPPAGENYGNHRIYNHLVRDILLEDTLTIRDTGETQIISKSFTLNPAWYPSMRQDRIGLAVWVQNDTRVSWISGSDTRYNADVLNAASYEFNHPDILLVNGAGGNDAIDTVATLYEDLLVKLQFSVAIWDTLEPSDTATFNDRTYPTAAEMAKYKFVIWYTEGATTTFSSTDRTELTSYLSGAGSLFVEGENVADDANANGWVSWFQTALHSDHVTDNSGALNFKGIAGDPIGNGIPSGTVLTGSSPAQITAFGGTSAVPFTYSVGPNAGAVRATHDADSRTVHFAFDYFPLSDTTNSVATDETIMYRIITWVDGAAPPSIQVLQANGGENLTIASQYEITWKAEDVNLSSAPISLYYTVDATQATPVWNLISSNVVNDGSYVWLVPTANSAKCKIKLEAMDNAGNLGSDVSDGLFTIGNPPPDVNVNIVLSAGRHLISFPNAPSDTSIANVLSSLDPNYAVVRYYDASDLSDPWKSWVRTKGGGDLATLDSTQGFWIDLTAPDTLDFIGGGVLDTTTSLKAGWNLIGFPSNDTTYSVGDLKADTGATRVEGFGGGGDLYMLQALSDATLVEQEKGYWVYVPADVDWVKTY